MAFYIILWSFFLVLSISDVFGKKLSSGPIILLILLLAVFVGFRVDVGDDWAGYRNFYYTGIAEDKASGKMEPVFTLIRWICYHLGLSHALFFYVVSCFSLFCIYRAAQIFKVDNVYLVLFVYLSLFFCNFQFNIVRNGAMASCMWMAFAYKSQRQPNKALVWAAIGTGFHLVGAIIFLLLFVIDKRLSVKWGIIILGIGLGLFAFQFSQRLMALFPFLALIDRLEGYVDSDRAEGYGMSIGLIFNIAMFAILFFKFFKTEYQRSSTFRVLLNSMLISITVSLALNDFGTVVARIGQPLNMASLFLWPMLFSNLHKKSYKVLIFLVMSAYLFLYYQKSWNVVRENGDTPMLPYQIEMSQISDTHL